MLLTFIKVHENGKQFNAKIQFCCKSTNSDIVPHMMMTLNHLIVYNNDFQPFAIKIKYETARRTRCHE